MTSKKQQTTEKPAAPFLNWLGGKRQLLPTIQAYYPHNAGYHADTYIEPFVGGGAVLFDVLSSHSFKTVVINDLDPNPMNAYRLVRDHVEEYIAAITAEQEVYTSKDYDGKSEHYYAARQEFNALTPEDDPMRKAVLALFLNRVSFNSLYRMNRKGEMNASWSKDTRKFTVDMDNLRKVSALLNNDGVILENTSYANLEQYFNDTTFAFFDPPYRALSKTANFNRYGNGTVQEQWDDTTQRNLQQFVEKVDQRGTRFLMTNSDPKNTNPEDTFFDDLYATYDIRRVPARRSISTKASTRKGVNELFISNIVIPLT